MNDEGNHPNTGVHESTESVLAQRIAALEAENRTLAERYVMLEQETTRLAQLYVASRRLQESIDREDVLIAIAEVVANLVGSEEMAVFERSEDGRELSLLASVGNDAGPSGAAAPLGSALAQAIASGRVHVAPGVEARPDHEEPLACIPLRFRGRIVGAIAIHKLLPHKPSLEPVDHELFELLADQAGTALRMTSSRQFAFATSKSLA